MGLIKNIIVSSALGILVLLASNSLLSLFVHSPNDTNSIEVVLTIEALEDDFFELFYQRVEDSYFAQEYSQRIQLTGKKGIQKLKFNIPNNINFTRLRFDLGHNLAQDSIIFHSIELRSGSHSFLYNSELLKSVWANEYLTIDGSIFRFRNENNQRFPFFIMENIKDEISTLKTESPRIPVGLNWFLSVLFAMAVVISYLKNSSIQKEKSTGIKLFLSSFILCLFLPILTTNTEYAELYKRTEKRQLAEMPEIRFSKSFAGEFESYFNDNFSLRNLLIHLSSSIKVNWFKSSPQPEKTKFGKENFLFLNDEGAYLSYSHTRLWEINELQDKCELLMKRNSALEQLGIKYFCTFWPNKHSIYPELLPYSMKAQIKGDKSDADLLYDILKDNDFPIFDIRDSVKAQKKQGRMFYKLDSHWNNQGSYFGYRAFLNLTKSFTSIEPIPLDSFEISPLTIVHGDLIHVMGKDSLKDNIDIDLNFTVKNKPKVYSQMSTEGFPESTIITKNEFCGNKKRVLIFRDSFTTNMVYYFSSTFYEVTYIWSSYDKDMVNKIHPDIVISCPVERLMRFI